MLLITKIVRTHQSILTDGLAMILSWEGGGEEMILGGFICITIYIFLGRSDPNGHLACVSVWVGVDRYLWVCDQRGSGTLRELAH